MAVLVALLALLAPIWILSLSLGQQRKDVRLLLDYPTDLDALRERLIELGGPDAWRTK